MQDASPSREQVLVPDRTLVVALRAEPKTISAGSFTSSGITVATPIRLFNAALDLIDDHGVAMPYLAERLPQLNTDSWRVLPDGRMETRYQLKPGLAWHDGTPFSAEDFTFAWRVYQVPDLGISALAPVSEVEEILAPDDRTVLVRWKGLYPEAGVSQIGGYLRGIMPFPRHILDGPFQEARWETFTALSYWSRDYVGLGPYRLLRWEPGAFIEGVAFDGHALGRPTIGRIKIVFIGDSSTAMANILSGEIHVAVDSALQFQHGVELKRLWDSSGEGVVLTHVASWRTIFAQHRSELSTPPAIRDARSRRALAHAIDRGSLNDAVWDGQGIIANTFFAPSSYFFPQIDEATIKYPYDLRRGEQLMETLGFARAADGVWTSPVDGKLELTLTTGSASARNDIERSVLASGWRQAGFGVQETVIGTAQALERESQATFPSLLVTGTGLSERNLIDSFASIAIPSAANRWGGENKGGWSNPVYDRVRDAFARTLDADDQVRQRVQMARLLSEELPAIPLYFGVNPIAHVASLRGVSQTSSPGTTGIFSWNVHVWELN
ncbi:MAG: hypothetical protein HW416_2727 [Chloroflexi bacterium]|nr:hypothetical protein [Chloroflexota bacterium]